MDRVRVHHCSVAAELMTSLLYLLSFLDRVNIGVAIDTMFFRLVFDRLYHPLAVGISHTCNSHVKSRS